MRIRQVYGRTEDRLMSAEPGTTPGSSRSGRGSGLLSSRGADRSRHRAALWSLAWNRLRGHEEAGIDERIAILGTKDLCLRVIEALRSGGIPCYAVTVDDSTDGRSELERLAAAGARVAGKPREAYGMVLEGKPRAVIVAGWYWLIPDEILNAVPAGFIGLHYSALPSYRGSSPVVWALINGDPTIGYSIFQLTTGMDEGPLWAQGRVARGDGYIGGVLNRLADAAVPDLVDVARGILDGSARPTPQSAEHLSYAAPRTPDDGRIDWTLDAISLERFVRAQSHPYPGAFATLSSQVVRIWDAAASAVPHYGTPGQIVMTTGDEVVVACGDGSALVVKRTPELSAVRFGRFI